MCQMSWNVTYGCGHQWAQIIIPCAPGMGFDNCPTFQGGMMSLSPGRKQFLPPGTCPYCNMSGWYDMNWIRMITKVNPGYQYGPTARKGGGISCVVLWLLDQQSPGYHGLILWQPHRRHLHRNRHIKILVALMSVQLRRVNQLMQPNERTWLAENDRKG